jgi:hypothetical protein
MKAILIDPERRSVAWINLPNADQDSRAAMQEIIGCDGFDYAVLDDLRDSIWVDEFGLTRGEAIYAFKLPVQPDPYAGKAIVIGATETGATCAPQIPIEVLRADITWLGLIVPEVTLVQEAHGVRAVVTYRRK